MTIQDLFKLTSRKTQVKSLFIIILAIISSWLASLWPVKLAGIYTDIANGSYQHLQQALGVLLGLGAIYLSAECLSIVKRVLLDCIIADHEAEVRERTIGQLLKMPVSWYSGQLSGERTAQLNQGVSGLSQLIKILCDDILSTVLIAAWTLYQVSVHAPILLTLLMIAYLAAAVLLSWLQIRSQNGIRENIILQKNALDGQICQSISNLELIRSMNAGSYEKRRLRPSILKIGKTEKRHHEYMGMYDCLKQACKVFFQITILAVCIVLIAQKAIAPASVITVCVLFQQLIKPIDEIYRFMDETASSALKAEVLKELEDAPVDPIFQIQPRTEKRQSDSFQNKDKEIGIKLDQVIISNPEKTQALAFFDQVNLPGDSVIAIQGESGCGKTTMMRGINRYYPKTKGKIELFGEDLDTISQEELAQEVFYLPQKPYFFAGSVRDNLIYGIEKEIKDQELKEALSKSELLDTLEVKGMENHCDPLDVLVGEGGSGLSGGEGQRLSIARAFLRKPKLLIFDESTANLDSETALIILEHIEAYARKNHIGIIYISHDEHVVERCRKVIPLENKITELKEF